MSIEGVGSDTVETLAIRQTRYISQKTGAQNPL